MEFINIAKQRQSVRSYNNKKVEPEKLEKILEAAHVAPTAANLQPVHLIAVQSEEGLATTKHGYVPSTRSRRMTSMRPF